MKRLSVGAIVVLLLVLLLGAATFAAVKNYQFTGVVKAVDGETLTVEKSATEVWQFERAKDTKGASPKIGDRVTVSYKMVTTDIEAKPAAVAAKSAEPAKKK